MLKWNTLRKFLEWNTLTKFLTFGIVAAFLRPLKNMGHKYVLDNGPESLEANLCFWIAILALILPYALWHWSRKKKEDPGFRILPNRSSFPLLLGSSILNAIAFLIYMHALKYDDFSIVIPIRNLVPIFPFLWIFLTGLGCILLGKKLKRGLIKKTEAISLALVVVGIFLLTLNFQKDFLAELLTIPCLLAFITAMLFAITVFVQSYALGEKHGKIDVIIYLALMLGINVIIFAAIVALKGTLGQSLQTLLDFRGALVFIGIVGFFSTISIMQVIKLATDLKEKNDIQSAPLLSTIMLRGQILPSVLIGGICFQEENIFLRLMGATVLTIGIILIVLPEKKKEDNKLKS